MKETNLPEVFPTVVVDLELGDYFDNFDVDLAYLAGYLGLCGLTNEQICGLTINFSAAEEVYSTNPLRFNHGHYNSVQRKCTIFPGTIDLAYRLANRDYGHPESLITKLVAEEVAQASGHELEHYVSDSEQGYKILSNYTALPDDWDEQSYQAYYSHPEEIRAREAEALFDPEAVVMR